VNRSTAGSTPPNHPVVQNKKQPVMGEEGVMPREYVYSEFNDPLAETAPQMAASVGWSKEADGGSIQLATIRNGKEHSYDPVDGLYMDLDRKQINQLIRLLRKARDDAFGRDE
jgi:hypothetical protein